MTPAIQEPSPTGTRSRGLLVLGATVGIVCAAGSLLMPKSSDPSALGRGAVASVNSEPIRSEEYERAIAALAADRRGEIGQEERRRVLDRLIEEELLIQRAIELGFTRRDRRVRSDLVSTMIQVIVSKSATQEPTLAEVEAFYKENLDYFTQPGRLHVREILVRVGGGRSAKEALERGDDVARRLRAGEPFGEVERELGDAAVAKLPNGLLPAKQLREYLGPTAARAALALEPGQVSDPVRTASGVRVLQMLEREPASAPSLEEIESEVRAEVRRRAGDRALRAYIDQLRERADVQVAELQP